ncbi:MAG TPA: hypothetical protein PLE81_08550 [Brevundimonas sp.]|jgi:hypothetical protein|uniref:hypothetical protein n=1 Tax=Brevundimonas sp. TaxID=1871086 RepID=UPI002B96D044|nr:hypothetical protein [Brevundimonas sp.]HRH20672.1 hypothetical protein [Brevundimonas sp.]
MRRMPGLATILGLLAGLSACTTLGGVAYGERGRAPLCAQQTPEIFVLTGGIDAEMAACVERSFQASTREVHLDSPGGHVGAALDIAAHFEGRGLVMRVVDECNSSCANYFLPLAGRIVVEPGAIIMLHGSLDPALRAHMIDERETFIRERMSGGASRADAIASHDSLLANLEATSARQAEFAARNRVAPGWLLHRQPGSDDILGTAGEPDGAASTALIVEEAFMRSCLAGVQINPFDARLGRGPVGLFARTVARLRGFAWSGEMRCVV